MNQIGDEPSKDNNPEQQNSATHPSNAPPSNPPPPTGREADQDPNEVPLTAAPLTTSPPDIGNWNNPRPEGSVHLYLPGEPRPGQSAAFPMERARELMNIVREELRACPKRPRKKDLDKDLPPKLSPKLFGAEKDLEWSTIYQHIVRPVLNELWPRKPFKKGHKNISE